MKCLYFEDEECESRVINTSQCNKCLVLRNAKLLKTMETRINALENPVKKTTGRAKKSTVTGKI